MFFHDTTPRANLGRHYAVDTNVFLYSLGRIPNLSLLIPQTKIRTKPREAYKWMKSSAITIYSPIYYEIKGMMPNTKRARTIWSPNIRVLFVENWLEKIQKLERELYLRLLNTFEDKTDIALLCLSKHEDATIVSFDYLVNEAAESNEIKTCKPWIEFRHEFEYKWDERLK